MKLPVFLPLALTLSFTPVWAQSLKPEAPAPLQPGLNCGTVDNMVGTHYWYFTGGPGKTNVHAKFKAMGLLGNPYRSDITVTLSDAANTWHSSKVLSSESQPVEYTFNGDLKNPTKIIVTVAPPDNGLVRMGGDYQLDVTGAIAFGEKSNIDPVIGKYNQMCGYTATLGTCTFHPDGSIDSTSGINGHWQLFDPSTQTYVINIDGQDRHSLQFVPGRGLCDGDSILFQQLK
jgi:hypothetical protein